MSLFSLSLPPSGLASLRFFPYLSVRPSPPSAFIWADRSPRRRASRELRNWMSCSLKPAQRLATMSNSCSVVLLLRCLGWIAHQRKAKRTWSTLNWRNSQRWLSPRAAAHASTPHPHLACLLPTNSLSLSGHSLHPWHTAIGMEDLSFFPPFQLSDFSE